MHLFSDCQYEMMQNMVTEWHNIAARMIAKAISKGAYGANMVRGRGASIRYIPYNVI